MASRERSCYRTAVNQTVRPTASTANATTAYRKRCGFGTGCPQLGQRDALGGIGVTHRSHTMPLTGSPAK